MGQPVVTRSQRRIERKQVVLIGILILAVAGTSFVLGVKYGQRSADGSGLGVEAEKPKVPMASKLVSPPPPPEAAPEKPERLTFYENLPKGSQAPLGSGINLPPEQGQPVVKKKQKRTPDPVSLPSTGAAQSSIAPSASADGAFIVQVASFRTGEDAAKLAGRLKNYKLNAFVESADLGDKGVWHRVLSGPYADRASADKVAALLREKERLSALVRQR